MGDDGPRWAERGGRGKPGEEASEPEEGPSGGRMLIRGQAVYQRCEAGKNLGRRYKEGSWGVAGVGSGGPVEEMGL